MGGFGFGPRLGAAVLAATVMFAPAISPEFCARAHADLNQAVSVVEPATARIDTAIHYQHAIGAGTGIVLDPGGVVLTNFHVVQSADTINATVAGRQFPADLVGYDRHHDVAVLQLRGAGGLPTVAIGDSSQVATGEPVVALGNADGTGSLLTKEAGQVVGLGRSINAQDSLTGSSEQVTGLIQFAAPVRAGDSGGPLVNSAGQVVGMTTAATLNYKMGPGGAGFAIPINQALAIAGQIRSHNPSDSVHIGPPTLLGVGVTSADQQARLPGVLIHEVINGGPAQQAGMVSGDVLVSVDGVSVNSATALTSALDRHYPGDAIDLLWIDRTGQQRNGRAMLTA